MSGAVVLSPYRCTGWNRRTHRPCTAVVIDAWSAAGAVVRRRCGDCGTWQTIEVEGTPMVQEKPPLANVVR
jgi:surface antigen